MHGGSWDGAQLGAGPGSPCLSRSPSVSEKHRSKKGGSSHLRAARRQGRTVLHQLTHQFTGKERGEMKINSVRTHPLLP